MKGDSVSDPFLTHDDIKRRCKIYESHDLLIVGGKTKAGGNAACFIYRKLPQEELEIPPVTVKDEGEVGIWISSAISNLQRRSISLEEKAAEWRLIAEMSRAIYEYLKAPS